jgi:hypothetical protein
MRRAATLAAILAYLSLIPIPTARAQAEAPASASLTEDSSITAASSGTFTATPLGDFAVAGTCGTKYLGLYTGGFYPGCSNLVPAPHSTNAAALAAAITPLDITGSPDANGTIVIAGAGMSLAALEFSALTAAAKPGPHISLQNEGQAQNDAPMWISGTPGVSPPACRVPQNACREVGLIGAPNENEYDEACADLSDLGLSCDQVQVVWYENTNSHQVPDNVSGCFGDKVLAATWASSGGGTETITAPSLAELLTAGQTITTFRSNPSGFDCVNCLVTAVDGTSGTVAFRQPVNPGSPYLGSGIAAGTFGTPIMSATISQGIETVGATSSTTGSIATQVGLGDSVTVVGSKGCDGTNLTVTAIDTALGTVTFTNGSRSGICTGGTIFGFHPWNGGPQWIPALPIYLLCSSLDPVAVKNNDFTTNAAYNVAWEFGQTLRAARANMANLDLAFGSSRIYAGYCTSGCEDGGEPFAYEVGFAWQMLIAAQINEEEGNGVDHVAGDLCPPTVACAGGITGSAPLVLWTDSQGTTIYSAYGWTSGETATAEDGQYWCGGQAGSPCHGFSDYEADHIHCNPRLPAPHGCAKMGGWLDSFFVNDAYTAAWWGD